MRPVHSPSIRSRYDYFYNMLPSTMGQASATGSGSNFHDSPQANLFGDPIPPPPPTGFVDGYESELYDPGGRSPTVTYGMGYINSSSNTVPRMANTAGYDLQMGSSPSRSGSSVGNLLTVDTSFARPKSSLNRTSTSGTTTSDRSPGDYSTPRLLSANTSSRGGRTTTFQDVSPLPDSMSTMSSSTTTAVGGFSRDVLDERERKASAVRRSREPSPVTVVTDFITTGPYRNFAPGPGMSNYSLPDTRTSNKKPSFSILLDNHGGSPSFKHLAALSSSGGSQPQLYRPHSDHQQHQRYWRTSMSSSSSRETSPTKQLYYSPSHSTPLYRPATTVGFSQQQQQHHSVPDLYGSRGVPGRFVQTKQIPMSSRSKRASFETLPQPDDEDMEAYEISTDVHHKTLIQIPGGTATVPRNSRVNRSHETLSNIVRNEVGLSSSLRDLQKAGTIPKRKKMPPIRSSRGVVQVLGESSATKIPRRQSVSEGSGRRKSQAPNFRTQARASRRGSVAPPVEEVRSKTPSSRRQSVSRPTTLSPIIGTPNKDSELSAASEKDLVLPDSPSRIPISSRSSSRAHSQHREPSPMNKRSPSKDSKSPTSILRKTPIAITTSLHRPSNAGAGKKNIPVFGSLRKNAGNKVGPAPKNVPGAKKPAVPKRPVKRNLSLKSETSTDDSKKGSSRQASPDKKLKSPSPTVKRSPSPNKRDASPAIREPSPTPSKRSSSPAKRDKSPPKAESPQDKKMKRLLSKDSFQSKSNDSIRKKTLEKKNSFKKQQSNPDLIKLAKKKSDEDQRSINSIASASSIVGVVSKAGEKFKKLVPLTKQNVVSMTTAAVVSQPAQIQTTLTNQLSQSKLVEAKRSSDESTTDPVAIIEHSQKTLESIQKTMSDATEEINKTIEENLTHLKDLGTAISDSPKPMEEKRTHPGMLSKDSKPPSSRDLLKKRMEMGTPKGTPKNMPKTPQTTPMTPKPAIPVEPTVNVIEKPPEPKPAPMPKVDPATMTNTSGGTTSEQAAAAGVQMVTAAKKPEVGMGMGSTQPAAHNQKSSTTTAEESKQQQQTAMASGGMQKSAAMGGSGDGGVGKGLGVGQTQPPVRSNGNNNNNNNNNNGKGGGSSLVAGQSVMPSTSSPAVTGGVKPPQGSSTAQGTPTTSVTHVDEKRCCKLSKCCDPCCVKLCCCLPWGSSTSGVDGAQLTKMQKLMQKMNCCNKKEAEKMVEVQTITQMNSTPPQPGCCRSFWDKLLCCRSKQKVGSRRSSQMILGDVEETKCCFCIPCRKKRRQSVAWSEDRQMSNSSQKSLPPQSFCSRLFQNVCCCFCCRRKNQLDSRRTSMNSKKPSLDGRPKEKPKLDHALIEHNSMMKAALPALPICLAYLCLICNVLIPGLGTILSGLLCVCFGKPRFSQLDGPKPRIGSLLINIIVGVSQAFCVIFCLVGWGWSIWWGLILVQTAKKLRRIKKAERITADVNAGKKIEFGKKKHKKHDKHDKQKDVEAGVK